MTPHCFHLSGTENSKLALPSQMPLQWPVGWSLNSEPRVSLLPGGGGEATESPGLQSPGFVFALSFDASSPFSRRCDAASLHP